MDVKTELLINGKVVANPRIKAPFDQQKQVSQRGKKDSTHLKVLARPADEKMEEIYLDFDLEYTAGDRHIRATPQVIAKSGDEAIMTLEESTKGEKIQLKVMAKPIVRQ